MAWQMASVANKVVSQFNPRAILLPQWRDISRPYRFRPTKLSITPQVELRIVAKNGGIHRVPEAILLLSQPQRGS